MSLRKSKKTWDEWIILINQHFLFYRILSIFFHAQRYMVAMVNFQLPKWPPIVAIESDVTPTNPIWRKKVPFLDYVHSFDIRCFHSK